MFYQISLYVYNGRSRSLLVQSTKLLGHHISFPPQPSTKFLMIHSDYLCSGFKETWIIGVIDVIPGEFGEERLH